MFVGEIEKADAEGREKKGEECATKAVWGLDLFVGEIGFGVVAESVCSVSSFVGEIGMGVVTGLVCSVSSFVGEIDVGTVAGLNDSVSLFVGEIDWIQRFSSARGKGKSHNPCLPLTGIGGVKRCNCSSFQA